MEKFRSINEYLEATHQTRNDVINGIAESALTILMFVDEHSELEVSDVMKLSEPLHVLYGLVTEVNESINPQKPESV